jgi:hypothetical protein
METGEKRSIEFEDLTKGVINALLLESPVEIQKINEIARLNAQNPDILHYLLNHQHTPEETRRIVAEILHLPVPVKTFDEDTDDTYQEEEWDENRRMQSLFQSVQRLKVGEKIQLALRGSKEIRSILLRDSSKEVVLTVLDNPKMTDSEVVILAKQKTTQDEVIRTIATKREWLKKYSIVHALITNPKTPPSISIRLIAKLRTKDLSLIEKNRNIPEAVRAAVKKTLIVRSKA